jgi:hypothetical protein
MVPRVKKHDSRPNNIKYVLVLHNLSQTASKKIKGFKSDLMDEDKLPGTEDFSDKNRELSKAGGVGKGKGEGGGKR